MPYPTPNPSTWEVEPYLINSDTALMIATTASGSGGIRYGFTTGSITVWQSTPLYQASGLSPETTYAYTVTTRLLPDGLPTDASESVSFTTPTTPVLTYPKFKNESLIST